MDYNFSVIFIGAVFRICATNPLQYCTQVNINTQKCNHIPGDIPFGTTSVRIIDFKRYNEMFIVNSSHFHSDNWGKLKSLEISYDGDESIVSVIFKKECFKGLKLLHELHIHLKPIFILEQLVFNGLNSLKLLDLGSCVRMNIMKLVPSLEGQEQLPRLEYLNLSLLNYFRDPISVDNAFARALGDKNISSLGMSYTRISEINSTALTTFIKTLKNVNVSYSSVTKIVMNINATLNNYDRLDVLDFSHTDVCRISVPFKIVDQTWNISRMKENKWFSVIAPTVVNMSACVHYPAFIWIGNSTVNINSEINVTTEVLIGRQNNLKHLDLSVNCNNHVAGTVKHIDIAGNGLDFLHPTLLSCLPNLNILDMSNNQLFQMQLIHPELFLELLYSAHRLKVIKMSSNFLKSLPRDMFIENNELEAIDLSHNDLDQVTFALSHVENLKALNLRNNKIKILTETSMRNLNSVNTNFKMRRHKTSVYLENNPILCSKCEAKASLQWLTITKSINIQTPNVTCMGENGKTMVVNEQVLQLVLDMCKRRIIIISTTVAVTVLAFLVILLAFMTCKFRKRAMKKANKRILLHKIQEGHDEFEFVIFLSHSSDDKDFVDAYVVKQLNENLQLMTEIDRNLVCIGDDFLRPGFRILDEITNCIDRASAFIVVLSDSFCESMYCHHEVDMAFRLNKPIMLMIKGRVDENIMKPLMKTLFKSTVRVLWTLENNEYIMNTSWEHVCNSLLDLIAAKY